MTRGSKIATAAGILMAGLALALLFRHDGLRGNAPSDDLNRLAFQGRMESDAPIAPAIPSVTSNRSKDISGGLLTPSLKPSPQSSHSSSGSVVSMVSASTAPHAAPNRSAGQKPLRRHKIVDGDTLPSLAQRYLGGIDRAKEIFDLNRSVLPSPEILPIGQEIQLPPRETGILLGEMPRIPAQACATGLAPASHRP